MLNTDDYEVLKSSFVESKRLFSKLGKVANSAANIDYDESGLYQDDVDTYSRHWLTLSTKIVDALSDSMDGYSIELLKNDLLETKSLTFNLSKEEESSKIVVEYSDEESISITQIS